MKCIAFQLMLIVFPNRMMNQAIQSSRLIDLPNIKVESDDIESWRHLFHSANETDIEGLVATTLHRKKTSIAPEHTNKVSIMRGLDNFMNDFSARINWCLINYVEAFHPPLHILNTPQEITE